MAWLLAHDKIGVPVGPTVGSLVVDGGGEGRCAPRRFRLDDPLLPLADDVTGEDMLSVWSTDEGADALAALAGRRFGATVLRLTAPGTAPLAVISHVRLVDRFRSGAGGVRLTLAWPARLRGAASEGWAGGVVQHGSTYAAPGENCLCPRFDCGGVDPVTWCQEHGTEAGPVAFWGVPPVADTAWPSAYPAQRQH